MPVSGKTAAPHEIPFFLGNDAPPDMGDVTEAMAKRIHERFGAIDLSQFVVPKESDAKILVVKDGAVAYKAMKGDATIDEEGKLSIGAKKILTGMLADLAVATGKIDNGAVTSEKLANDSVDATRIAPDAVGSSEIASGAVGPLEHGVMPSARVARESNQVIPNEVWTAILFTSELFDSDTIHDNGTNPSRLTCKTPGLYIMQGTFPLEGNATADRAAMIRRNGSLLMPIAEASSPGRAAPLKGAGGNAFSLSGIYRLAKNDYVELCAWQNTGGSLNVMAGDGVHQPEFAMAFIGA